jgi:hypothetical protein
MIPRHGTALQPAGHPGGRCRRGRCLTRGPGAHPFGLWSFESHENVITRKAPRHIHGSDRRFTMEVIIRVSPALSDNAGIARSVYGELWQDSWMSDRVRGVS